jgi:hypothetical protein
MRTAVRKFLRRKAHELHQFHGSGANTVLRPTLKSWNHADIALNREMRKQSRFLNDVSDAPAQLDGVPLCGRASFDHNLTLCWVEQPVDQFQKGGFP